MKKNKFFNKTLLQFISSFSIAYILLASQNALGVDCDKDGKVVGKFDDCNSVCQRNYDSTINSSYRDQQERANSVAYVQKTECEARCRGLDLNCTPEQREDQCKRLPKQTEFEATRPAYVWNCPEVQGIKGLPASLKVTGRYPSVSKVESTQRENKVTGFSKFANCAASTEQNGKYIRHSGWVAQYLDSINKDNPLEAKDSSFCLYLAPSSGPNTYYIAAKTDTALQFASSLDGPEFKSPTLNDVFKFQVTNVDKACVPKVEKAKFKASTSKYLSTCKDVELTLNGSKNILKGLSTRLQLTSKDGCENPGLNKYLKSPNWTAQFSVNDTEVADDGSSFCLYLAPSSTNTYYISANAGNKQQFASSEDGLNYMSANIDPKYSFEVSDVNSVCTPLLNMTKFEAVSPAYKWSCKDVIVNKTTIKGFPASLIITSATTPNSCVRPSMEKGQYLRHADWSAQFLSTLNKNNILEAKDSSFCLYQVPGTASTYFISAVTDNEQKFVSSGDASKYMSTTVESKFYFTVTNADKVKPAQAAQKK